MAGPDGTQKSGDHRVGRGHLCRLSGGGSHDGVLQPPAGRAGHGPTAGRAGGAPAHRTRARPQPAPLHADLPQQPNAHARAVGARRHHPRRQPGLRALLRLGARRAAGPARHPAVGRPGPARRVHGDARPPATHRPGAGAQSARRWQPVRRPGVQRAQRQPRRPAGHHHPRRCDRPERGHGAAAQVRRALCKGLQLQPAEDDRHAAERWQVCRGEPGP